MLTLPAASHGSSSASDGGVGPANLAQQPAAILRGRRSGVRAGGEDRFAYVVIGSEAEVGHGPCFRIDPRDAVVKPALRNRAGGDIAMPVLAARPRGIN